MARPLKYQPEETRVQETAREELDCLLETLHTSGTLEVLNALVGRIGAVSEIVGRELDTEAGRKALGNLAVAGVALTALPPPQTQALLRGVAEGLAESRQHAREKPPSLLRLTAQLRHEDVRRGMQALVTVLGAVGRQLGAQGGEG